MKVSIASDLHLEFGDINIYNIDDSDILILAGDITIANYLDLNQTHLTSGQRKVAKNTYNFFNNVCKEFKDVIYIAGNHEHYQGDFAKTINLLKDNLNFANLHILEKDFIEINNYIFIGGTFWTNCNNEDPDTKIRIKKVMHDFSSIKNSSQVGHKWVRVPLLKDGVKQLDIAGNDILVRKAVTYIPGLSIVDILEDHNEFIKFFNSTISQIQDKNIVVITHHSPTKLTIHDLYKHDYSLSGAYSSNLDNLIEDNPNIKLWVCGHTHHDFDINIGNTRLVINPRGYIGFESSANSFRIKTVEI